MNKMDNEKLVFIQKVTNQVNELHRQVINTRSEIDSYNENIVFCMNCLWKEEMVDRGWAGTFEEWVPKFLDKNNAIMDENNAIILIQKLILPRLKDALKNVIDTKSKKILTTLVRDVEVWFAISSGDDDVNELNVQKPTPDIDARVEELEKEVHELQAQVRTLTFEHPPEFHGRESLLQKLARLT